MNFQLSEIEKKRAVYYGERDQHQGHWGNGEMVIPEYAILVNLMKNEGAEIDLTLLQTENLVRWMEEATRRGAVVSPEDRILAGSLTKVLKPAYDDCHDQLLKARYRDMLGTLCLILGQSAINPEGGHGHKKKHHHH